MKPQDIGSVAIHDKAPTVINRTTNPTAKEKFTAFEDKSERSKVMFEETLELPRLASTGTKKQQIRARMVNDDQRKANFL